MTAAKRSGELAAARARRTAQVEDSFHAQSHCLHSLNQAIESMPVHEVVVGEYRGGRVKTANDIPLANPAFSLLRQHKVARI